MKVKFWGVRGSVPTPWKDAMDVGGNTSCVQVIPRDDVLMILDAGTGIRFLGDFLMAQGGTDLHGHLLLSHAHWDHIQGFPFFIPAYLPGNRFTVYGARRAQKSLYDIVSGQMVPPYFPVDIHEMKADLDFVELGEESFTIAQDVQVQTCSFRHPGGVFGFRIEYGQQVVVFATDMEYTETDLDQRLIDFCQGADLLIYDSQYTPEELKVKTGWGHSTHIAAAHLGKLAQVRQVLLYHHDPSHSDEMLAQMEQEAQAVFPPCQLAKEGMIFDLDQIP